MLRDCHQLSDCVRLLPQLGSTANAHPMLFGPGHSQTKLHVTHARNDCPQMITGPSETSPTSHQYSRSYAQTSISPCWRTLRTWQISWPRERRRVRTANDCLSTCHLSPARTNLLTANSSHHAPCSRLPPLVPTADLFTGLVDTSDLQSAFASEVGVNISITISSLYAQLKHPP